VLNIEDVATKVKNTITQKIDDLWILWKNYEDIRKSWYKTNIDDIKPKIDDILSQKRIKIVDWKLDFTDSAIWATKSKRAIQEAYNIIKW
jgi:hypothetical protein